MTCKVEKFTKSQYRPILMTSYRRQQLRYILVDFLSAELVWLAFLFFRWVVYEGKVMTIQGVLIPAFDFYPPLFLYPLGCLIVYYLSGYYLRPFNRSLIKEFLTTLVSAIVIALSAFFIIVIDDQVVSYQRYFTSLYVLFALQFFVSYTARLAVTIFSRHYHIQEEVIVIDAPVNDQQVYQQIAQAYPTGKPIYIRPRVYDLLTGAARIRTLNEEALVCVTDLNMTDAEVCIKRAFDIVTAGVSLIVLSPLFAFLSVVVYMSSKGPVIYSQERIGLHGKSFRIYKFRTMIVSAEEKGIPQLSRKDDDRITRVGKWMRRYRLDELPQVWNVIKGDMSIVGPRPERPYFVRLIELQAPYYCLLYKIRPGLTSWGPIKVGYTDTMEKMIKRLNYDIAYMENMSLLLDLRIMLSTISVLLRGNGQ